MKPGSVATRIVWARVESVGHAVAIAVALCAGRKNALRIPMIMTVCMPHRRHMMRLHVTVSAVVAVGIPYGVSHCGGRREKHGCAG
jgi:hypothetical protein